MKPVRALEPQTVAVVLGFAIGLGLAVHEVFFIVALAVIVLAAIESAYNHAAVAHHRNSHFKGENLGGLGRMQMR